MNPCDWNLKTYFFPWKTKFKSIFVIYNNKKDLKVQKYNVFIYNKQNNYALHYTYKLQHILKSKQKKIQYNYLMAFNYISSLVENNDCKTSFLV